MRAHAFAHIRADGLGELRCGPPLTLRRVHAEPGETALCLVGTAAGPLAGDVLQLDLLVDDGARARLSATGAALAQGRGGEPGTLTQTADVRGSLVADPGPLIVAEGSRVDVAVALELAVGAHVEWHELVVLGRTTDRAPGRATLRWDVVRAGRPVLRQLVDSRDVPHRVMATTLLSGPDVDARTVVASATAVAQRVDARTQLVTVLGADAAEVRRELAGLLAQLRPASGPHAASTADSTTVAIR